MKDLKTMSQMNYRKNKLFNDIAALKLLLEYDDTVLQRYSKQVQDRLDTYIHKDLNKKSSGDDSIEKNDVLYNTLNQKVRFILHRKNSDENFILLAYIKRYKMYISPKVFIKQSVLCTNDDELFENLFYLGYKYYEFFFGVKILDCCKFEPILINNTYIFFLTNGEWKPLSLKPHQIINNYITHILEWNVTRAVFDKKYAKSYTLGDETLDVIKELIKRRYIKL